MIIVKGLSKRFKLYDRPLDRLTEWLSYGTVKRHTEFWALRDFNLEVDEGECVGIIGPNGAGKSTLLKILSGTMSPTSGSYRIKGRVLSLLELGTGFNPELTGRQNIVATSSLLGFPERYAEEQMGAIRDFADLADFFDRPLKIYSTGMSVRLAFAMFAFMNPETLIVDEALSVGDVGFQRKCYKRIERMLGSGVTCLLVTHDLSAVIKFCTRALVLLNGTKIFEGDPREACNELNKIYFGESAVVDTSYYGDGSASIESIWFEDTTGNPITSSPSKQPVVLCYSIEFNTNVTDPVCGFHIKTVHGVEVALASSDYLGYHFGDFNKNDRLTLRWILDLNLNPGIYFFGCGCRYSHVDRFMCRRVDAVKLPVIDVPVMSGIINPFRELKLEYFRG